MPLYTYSCKACGTVHEELKAIPDRMTDECPSCGEVATLLVTPVHLDYLRSGVDTGFPTAAAKWERMQRDKNSGKSWDSNNRRYGGEWERK